MRRIIIFIALMMSLPALRAAQISDAFYINSKFIKNDFSAVSQVIGRLSTGVEASYVKHKTFDDPNFMLAVPVVMSYEMIEFMFKPFAMPQTNNMYAYGASFSMLLNMEKNTVDDKFTQAALSAGYVNQKAYIARESGTLRDDCGQIAYGLSLRRNFYNAFVFGANGNIYQYLNGIAGVQAAASIFNQNDFSNLNTYDVVYGLPKYSAGATFDRILSKGANIYLAYSYTEFYTDAPRHSVILGNDFPVTKSVKADLGYNHVMTNRGGKKDIFKIALSVSF